MAKLVKSTKKSVALTLKEKVDELRNQTFTLELNGVEALALYAVANCIGGNGELRKTFEGSSGSIRSILGEEKKISELNDFTKSFINPAFGSAIYFKSDFIENLK